MLSFITKTCSELPAKCPDACPGDPKTVVRLQD